MTGYHHTESATETQPEVGDTLRVLLVEDEERLANTIARGLRREGMAADAVLDGKAAPSKTAVNS